MEGRSDKSSPASTSTFRIYTRSNLTATSQDADGNRPPAATYRPTTYTEDGAPRIVFRALRGAIWQIERDTLAATDLTTASNTPLAAGSPSAVFSTEPHIIYRGRTGRVIDLFRETGTLRSREITRAAADGRRATGLRAVVRRTLCRRARPRLGSC